MKGFPCFIDHPNFINDPTKLVSSQTPAHVQLLVCLQYFKTSRLTAIKNHWIKYCEKTYQRERINYMYSWYIKNSTEILNKLKAIGFYASTISIYDFLRFMLRYRTI